MKSALLALALLASPAAAHPCHDADPVGIEQPGAAPPATPCPADAMHPAAFDPTWGVPALLVALGAARRPRAWAAAPAFGLGAGIAALSALNDVLPALPWLNPALLGLAALALAWPRGALPAALFAGAATCIALRVDTMLAPEGPRLLAWSLGAIAAAMALASLTAPPIWRRVGPWPARVVASWSLAAAVMAAALAWRG